LTGSEQNPGADQSATPPAGSGIAAVDAGGTPPEVAASETLPILRSKLTAEGVLAALDAAARKGKLAGFSSEAGGAAGAGTRTFRVVDFGKPFESRLIGVIEELKGPGGAAGMGDAAGAASRITFSIQMKMMMPVIFAVLLIVSVWPGILLTDSMLKLYFSWYTIWTGWWYYPLTVPFVPIAFLKAWRTSVASGKAEAAEIVQGISEVV